MKLIGKLFLAKAVLFSDPLDLTSQRHLITSAFTIADLPGKEQQEFFYIRCSTLKMIVPTNMPTAATKKYQTACTKAVPL